MIFEQKRSGFQDEGTKGSEAVSDHSRMLEGIDSVERKLRKSIEMARKYEAKFREIAFSDENDPTGKQRLASRALLYAVFESQIDVALAELARVRDQLDNRSDPDGGETEQDQLLTEKEMQGPSFLNQVDEMAREVEETREKLENVPSHEDLNSETSLSMKKAVEPSKE